MGSQAKRPAAKSRHAGIRWRSLLDIRPSPENEQLYRPVLPTDPEVQSLAQSIREHGVKEPLVITADNYIISGHRRYVACGLAERFEVPVRIEPITRDSPQFLVLLREYNRQRTKSADEVLREEVVSANPDEAHRFLTKYRREAAEVDAEFIVIEGEKRRAAISKAKRPMLDAICRIIEERRAYWPLTDRQIHYALLNDPPLRHASKPQSAYVNNQQCYDDLTDLLTRARLAGEIAFNVIDDPTRPVEVWDFPRGVGPFIQEELGRLLKGYYRDLQQSQPNHIEIVGEKNTVLSIIKRVAAEFCIPLTIGRGYSSLPPRWNMCERFRASGKEQLIILVLSDFDPEGEDIPHSFVRSMRDDFGLENVKAMKVALTYQQVLDRDLPVTFDIKKSSSRYKKFAALYGDRAHELEAIPPADLQQLLTEAIEAVLDVAAYNGEIDAERQDAAQLDVYRRRVLAAIGPQDGAPAVDEEE
jgi:hypothetical protein